MVLSSIMPIQSPFTVVRSGFQKLNGKASGRMPVPEEAANLSVAFLPPMSGLAANETRLDEGAINVRIGEGRTAEVLRNLCYQVSRDAETWERLCQKINTAVRCAT